MQIKSQQSRTPKQYTPSIQDIDAQDQEAFLSLMDQTGSKPLKEQLRVYKRISQDAQNPSKHLIAKYLTLPILCEFVFGPSALRHQVLDVLRSVGASISKVSGMLKSLKTIQHYRNVSELLEFVDTSQQKEMDQLFLAPLMKEYRQSCSKIQSENFSNKWLESFLEVGRAINNCIKHYPLQQNHRQEILNLTRTVLKHYLVLRRDVLTHLYIIVISLSPEEPEPESTLQVIHYLHAKAVLQNFPVLERLLKYTTIAETEVKYHLLYVLQYSLENEVQAFPNKEEVFTAVVDLYQIGRSAYTMIEGMIKVVVGSGAKWNLTGYLGRNFFVVKTLLKCPNVSLKQIQQVWPDVLVVSLQHAGNLSTPFAIDCVEAILQSSFQDVKQNPGVWIDQWYDHYLRFLLHGQKLTVKGIIDQINPLITKIVKKPLILQRLLALKEVSDNKELGIISLLQCHKEVGMITAVNEQRCYAFKDYPGLKVSFDRLSDLLASNEPNISCKALAFVTISQKLSEPLVPFEYELVFQYVKYSLGTNSSQYRHRYLELFKKFFERTRNIYQKELIPPKRHKSVVYFKEASQFVVKLIRHCAQALYPEVPFEIACPVLEIWLMLLNYFGVYDFEIKKDNQLRGCSFLADKEVFTSSYFSAVALLLQSSFENIRTLALSILNQFPKQFKLDVNKLWAQCMAITNNLVIRQFQSGCRLMTYIFEKHHLYLAGINAQYQLPQLNLYYYLLGVLRSRFLVFKDQFAVQSEKFYQNLIHGLATILSYLFQKLGQKIRSSQETLKRHSQEIRNFLTELFKTMVEVLNFAVDISGNNVSTVVLDNTQTMEKSGIQMKIDCRGHFYQDQKTLAQKNIENILSGSTLMTSLDEEQNPNIENNLVVSFYLVSRELGLLFQSIVAVVQADIKEVFVPENDLVDLINGFFYALINLKHMGSVDRIAKGLQRMSRVLYKKDSQVLTSVPETLLKKLLQLLGDSKFTNILRRSAGIPFAFACLLKSEALRKRQLVAQTIGTLLEFAANETDESKQIRIHAFNILKKIFQDGDLRFQLDPYVATGFILSIKGFATEDWGVRNSSLMLFSCLAVRTLGPKPRLNLIQFFKRCPSLIGFFEAELKSYIDQKVMYPPIYPIALLLSRMVPFDKCQSPSNVDSHQDQPKQIHKSDFSKFIPLLEEAGNTPNCMGRIIIAKALIPFMEMKDIVPFCINTISTLTTAGIKSNHNKAHSKLMNIYQLLSSYYHLQQDQEARTLAENQVILFGLVTSRISYLEQIKCPFVQQIFCRILYKLLLEKAEQLKSQDQFKTFTQSFRKYCEKYLGENPPLTRFNNDLGHSTFRVTLLKTYLRFSEFYYPANQYQPFERFFSSLRNILNGNKDSTQGLDYQIVSTYVGQLLQILEGNLQLHVPQYLAQKVFEVSMHPQFHLSELPLIYRLVARSKINISKQVQDALISQEKATEDPSLKISIFQLLKDNITEDILLRYTDPEQLTALRGVVVQSIDTYNPQYDLVYLRLLDDEDHEIRKQISYRLSVAKGTYEYTESKVRQDILGETKRVAQILQDGDTAVKVKNFKEQRIFSYDKANRYKSDIYNIISLSRRLSQQELGEFREFSEALQENIDSYGQSIFSRNQYQFQLILKGLIYRRVQLKQDPHLLLQKVKDLDPIYRRVLEQ